MTYSKMITVFLALVLQVTFSFSKDDFAANGEFEDSEFFPSSHPYMKSMIEKSWEIDQPCRIPKGWIVNPTIPSGVYHYMANDKEAHSGEHFVRLKGDLYQTSSFSVKGGDKVTFSFWAKHGPDSQGGRGAFGGFYVTGAETVGSSDKLVFSEKTTGEWAQYTHEFIVPENYKTTIFNSFLRAHEVTDFDDVQVVVTSPE